MILKIKRVYEKAEEEDGVRILVDRLWPRGVTKEKLNCQLWQKEVAPSSELRKRFNHRPERFEEFREKYVHELETDPKKLEALETIREELTRGAVTMIYAARDVTCNHAKVLKDFLEG